MIKIALNILDKKQILQDSITFIHNYQFNNDKFQELASQIKEQDLLFNQLINELFDNFKSTIIKKYCSFIKNKDIKSECIKYYIELCNIIKSPFNKLAIKKIKDYLNHFNSLLNVDIQNFIDKLNNVDDAIGSEIFTLPFDANDINNRDKPLIIIRKYSNGNAIDDEVKIGMYGQHHSDLLKNYINKKEYQLEYITYGYVYNNIAFIGNQELQNHSMNEIGNIIKSKMPQITKVYYILNDKKINPTIKRLAKNSELIFDS